MGLLQPVPPNRQNPDSPSYQRSPRCAYHSGDKGHDIENCWTLKRVVEDLIEQKKIVLRDEYIPNVTNNPLPAHNNRPVIGMICEDKEFDPALKAIIVIANLGKEPRAVTKQDKGEKKSKATPQNMEKKVEVETGAAPSKDVVLYVPRGRKKEQMELSPPRRFELNKGAHTYVPKGTYVMRGPIILPRLSEPVVIGHAPQRPMTDPTAVPWNYNKSVVTYKGKEILAEVQENSPSEKYFNLEEVNNATKKRFPPKKPVSAEEAEAFFQKMKMADYEIIDQLQKSPAQVSLLSLLMNSTKHQKVLIKTLNKAYVPIETTENNWKEWQRGTERIRPNNVYVRAFHGIKRDTIGEIDLILTIGPVDFEVTLQVLDMDTSYNFLLGRSWIHAAGAVPSTLHHMVKFEHEDQDIVVHEEDE
ncbi:uncharacterized protein LOC142176257 [Nicotiana tabacum]|uniref:Uncharacterized protein LOC142176257 n=1 Tax=Nicotiana tabacum TaxID=4097 RepID=A0AC58TQI2_TOBAC